MGGFKEKKNIKERSESRKEEKRKQEQNQEEGKEIGKKCDGYYLLPSQRAGMATAGVYWNFWSLRGTREQGGIKTVE